MQINVEVTKKNKAGEEVVLDAPVTNWGLRAKDLPLLATIAQVEYSKKDLPGFEATLSLKELMNRDWTNTRKYSGLVPAWYYVHYLSNLRPYGLVPNPARVAQYKSAETKVEDRKFFILNKGKKEEMQVMSESMFRERWRARRQATGQTDPKYWINTLKKGAWAKLYVWMDWEISAHQYYSAFWSGPMFHFLKAGLSAPTATKVRIQYIPTPAPEAAPEVPQAA